MALASYRSPKPCASPGPAVELRRLPAGSILPRPAGSQVHRHSAALGGRYCAGKGEVAIPGPHSQSEPAWVHRHDLGGCTQLAEWEVDGSSAYSFRANVDKLL
jgi:hypothetical protein